jgi:hypothetical protein
LVFFYRCPVPAAFFAKHAPCFQVRNGVFDGGADFAQCGVERGLGGGEIAPRESFDRGDLDALDTDIAQVGRSGDAGELGGYVS